MPCNARKLVRIAKFILAALTVFSVSWIASVNEWHAAARAAGARWGEVGVSRAAARTMRTIVGYSEGKQAELDRPSPVACDRLPAFPEIRHYNRTWSSDERNYESSTSWQSVADADAGFGRQLSLYSAYYDDRMSQHYIRILATFHGTNFSTEGSLFCQTRPANLYEDSVEVVAAKPLEIWYHEWDKTATGIGTPLLLSCPLTGPLFSPSIVSVVTEPCQDPSNAFLLSPPTNKGKYFRKFTVCVKDMYFEKDIARHLIEWIETNRILGVGMIDLYVDRINRNTEKVLQYYRYQNFIRVFTVPIKNTPDRPIWQRRKDHILTYNDCLYRNIRESEFIIPLDIDEVILPKKVLTLSALVKRLDKQGLHPKKLTAILIQNVFYFEFMQRLDKYKLKQIHTNKSKIYVKRDDVRLLDNTDSIQLNEIELLDDTNSINKEVIDDRDIELEFKEEYKYRCGGVLPVPKLARHIVRSATVSPVGSYTKSLMVTKNVLTAFNHYPLASVGGSTSPGISAPFSEVQLNHYKESCNCTLTGDCVRYSRTARLDFTAMRLRTRLLSALALNAPCTTTTSH